MAIRSGSCLNCSAECALSSVAFPQSLGAELGGIIVSVNAKSPGIPTISDDSDIPNQSNLII